MIRNSSCYSVCCSSCSSASYFGFNFTSQTRPGSHCVRWRCSVVVEGEGGQGQSSYCEPTTTLHMHIHSGETCDYNASNLSPIRASPSSYRHRFAQLLVVALDTGRSASASLSTICIVRMPRLLQETRSCPRSVGSSSGALCLQNLP